MKNPESSIRKIPGLVAIAIGTLMVLVALPATFAAAESAAPSTAVTAGPHEHSESSNWAGYAVLAQQDSVTNVAGSWIVPTFHGSCESLDNESSAAFWVGIDGYGSNTVEQIGTSITCTSFLYIWGVSYTAWYEFYPAGQVGISMTIHPGDEMTADANYLPATGTYTLSIVDNTTGHSYAVSTTGVTADRSSAEWIAESPSNAFGIVAWVDFKSVSFTSSYATISGHTRSISKFSVVNPFSQINSVTKYGVVKGATSGLSDAGTAFKVTWKTYGP